MTISELGAGRYRVTRPLGRGSQGEVLLAHDTLLARAVVLKRVGIADDDEAQARAALGDELRLLAGLRHPNVVEVFELFEQDGSLFLVESYAPGVNPLAWVAAGAPADRIARACRVVAALLRGAQYLHSRGIVHRDIKPDNARVELDGLIGRLPAARLFDLGLATRAPLPEVTGTLAYAAPEVRVGAAASVASDLYSVGVLLHEALLGERPDPERDVRRLGLAAASAAGLPGLLVELLRDLLAREPEQRPRHGAIFEALSAAVGTPLQLTAHDLASDYFPRPPPVGAETMAEALESLADEAASGRDLVVAIDETPAEIAELLRARAQLRGLRLVRVAPRLELTAGVDDPQRIATRVADELLAESRPTLVDLLDCAADSEAARSLATQLRRAARIPAHQTRDAVALTSHRPPHAGRLVIAPTALLGDSAADHRLAAPPLSPLEGRELARALLYHLDAPWIDALADAAGGDRRLVVALVAAQIDAGLPAQLVVPADLAAASAARLAALPAAERLLVDALALSPRPLPLPVARAAGLVDEVDTATLVVRGLVAIEQATADGPRVQLADDDGATLAAAGPGLRLASLPLRRAAREALAVAVRRESLHARLAAAWREVTPHDPRALAHHLLGAGDAVGAGVELLRLAAFDEATLDDLARARAALQAAPDGQATPLWCDLTVRYSRASRARGDIDQALASCDALGAHDAARAGALRAELLLDAGRADEALVALEQAATLDSPRHVATRALLAARAHFVGGDYDAAERSAREALAGGAALDAASRARAANLVALARLYRGEVEAALQTLEPAVDDARAAGDAESLARLDATRGIALSRVGRLEDARAAYAECLEQAQRLGDLLLSASAALNLGTLAQRRGQLGDAYGHVARAVSLARRGDMRATLAMALANLGNLQLYFGALDEADASLASAVQTARAAGATTHAGHAELYRAELALARADRAGAEAALERARAAFADDAAGRDAAELFACELLLAASDPEAALARATALGARLAEQDPDRWIADFLRGRALCALERFDEALEPLEAARAGAGEHERLFECEAVLARCLQRLGREADAARRAERCRQRLDRARADVPRPLRAFFDRRPAVRAALEIADALDQRGVEGRASAAQLRRLLEVNQALNRWRDLDELLRTILDCLLELTGAEQGAVLLVPRDASEASVRGVDPSSSFDIEVAAARHLDASVTAEGMQRFSRSIARRAIAEDRPIVAADAAQDERFETELSVHGLQLRAVLCVPIHVQASVRGALYVDNRYRVGAFDGAAVELAQAFADQAGIALESARLLERAAHTEEQLRAAKAALEARGRALQARVEAQSEKLSAIELRLRSQDEELVRRYNAANIVGSAKPMRELFLKLDRVADADVSLFIHGESGTGKELVARAIHAGGRRAQHPFVTVNCGAIPETLLESELFGHVRGAFTGALRDRPGLFEVAGQGTLLLDEVGDMPPEMQVKLLRVLQESRFRRVGDDRERAAHCRVIAASHRDLERLVDEGRFREDLFYRLQVIKLVVPPLRERREDIPLLVAHLLGRDAPRVLPPAMRALIDYDWPGNVRQLENELARARVLADGDIDLADLSPPLRGIEVRPGAAADERGAASSLAEAVEKTERQLIERALAQTQFNVSRAAERLGIHRVALHRKIRKHGIERE